MAGNSIERDHIVARPKWYTALVVLELLFTVGIICLMFPYNGPEIKLPGLYRFVAFVVCQLTGAGL